MGKLCRRDFLFRSAALATGAVVLGGGRTMASQLSGPHSQFPTQPRERLAVATWPFRDFIKSPTNKWWRNPENPRDWYVKGVAMGGGRNPNEPTMDLKEFGAMVVQKFGVHNIELGGQLFSSTSMKYVHELREATEQAGVRVVDIATDLGASFYDTDPAERRKAVENGKLWVDIAVALGSPSVREHIQGPEGLKPDVARTVESVKQVAEYGADKNIIIALENGDNRFEDALFVINVIEKVNSPYLRGLPDFCNSMLTHDEEFNNRALEGMFKHAYNICHMKDSEMDHQGKVHTVDVAKCFEIAKASGYRGYFSMEFEGEGDPFAGTQKLIEESLKYLT